MTIVRKVINIIALTLISLGVIGSLFFCVLMFVSSLFVVLMSMAMFDFLYTLSYLIVSGIMVFIARGFFDTFRSWTRLLRL